jgi:hypothetical protein
MKNPKINKYERKNAIDNSKSLIQLIESIKAASNIKSYLLILVFGVLIVIGLRYATSKKKSTFKGDDTSAPLTDERELKSLIRMEIMN